MLLEQRESYADDQTCGKSGKRYHPSLQHEDPSDEAFLGTEAFQRGDIVLLFDDQHRQAAEDVECDDDYDEYQDHVDRGLLVFHHLVERLVLLEAVLDLETCSQPCLDLFLKLLGVLFRCSFHQSQLDSRHFLLVFKKLAHLFYRQYHELAVNL